MDAVLDGAASVLQMMIAVQGATITLAGNREGLEALSGWKGRAERAYRNTLEFLPYFGGLVLIGHVAGISSKLSVIGAQVFFYGRVAHAIAYTIGMPWVRSGMWLVSVAGLVLLALSILNA